MPLGILYLVPGQPTEPAPFFQGLPLPAVASEKQAQIRAVGINDLEEEGPEGVGFAEKPLPGMIFLSGRLQQVFRDKAGKTLDQLLKTFLS